MIIIDALRYDFTVPREDYQHYHNALTILHETSVSEPHNAFLLPFIADPPTTTLQRLKGLTTGTLPVFIDAGSNFAGTAIEEDNLLSQLRAANKTLVHLGDDTWHALFPGYFHPNLTHAYDSFNVWDLHTLDNGVTEHLLPLLEVKSEWDVIFGHYLGVDHAGHRYGPDHPAMGSKLRQMDEVLRNVMAGLDDETLLVVMGDHGMDAKGDHGGESDDEVEAALWMYSKKGIFGRTGPDSLLPPSTAKSRPVAQIDLVPTLSLLLGTPIPFNNLGAPIEEAFIGRDGKNWERLASVQALAASQIHGYQLEYSAARGLDENAVSTQQVLWNKALDFWTRGRSSLQSKSAFYRAASSHFSEYQKENLRVCRNLWARFDIPSMIMGITILGLALVVVLVLASSSANHQLVYVPLALRSIGIGTLAGAAIGRVVGFAIPVLSMFDACVLAASAGGLIGFVSAFLSSQARGVSLSNRLWTWLSIIFTVSQSVGFASNSYTIWEDEILLFFLSTFASLALFSSIKQSNRTDRILGTIHSCLFFFLTRIGSLSRLCREEQMPFCRSTFYASATSSTSATWQLLIPYAVAIVLPAIIKSYYQGTKSYEGCAIFWIGFAFRLGLLGSACYWTLDAADNGEWLDISSEFLKSIKISTAQIVLAIALAAGTANYVWAPPCVRIESGQQSEKTTAAKAGAVTIFGYANVHGSRYALLYSSWLLAVILAQKPMGGGAIGIMAWQMFSLLEIIDTNDLSSGSIGPVVLGLLGSFHFFKTGHQATIASIQWDPAFMVSKAIRYPWSPLLLLFNNFGSQMLAAIFVPLVVLWKQPPKKQGLLGEVSRAMAIHLSYYAVINLATTMWAGWLRRHLMLYRIFSPRFLTGAAVLLIVDIVGTFIALGGLRWNVLSVADVFGWK